MNLVDADLLVGEHVIRVKSANAVIRIDEHGLSQFAFDHLMGLVGLKGKEAIGGKLYLTNYRLLFKAHRLNRLRGKFSIFLPTIKALSDASRLLVRKMHIATHTRQFEFVVWGLPEFLSQIDKAKQSVSSDQLAYIRSAAVGEYLKCGEGLQIHRTLEAINVSILNVRDILGLIKIARDPLEAAGVLGLVELFSDE